MINSPQLYHDSLGQKLKSFKDEITNWETLATNGNQTWAKHQSQILRLGSMLATCTKDIESGIATVPTLADQAMKKSAELDQILLQSHAIWSYFRDKLLQRSSPGVASFLTAADELSWACYKPCMEVRVAKLQAEGKVISSKSPPLVYLGPTASPFVYTRNRAFSIPGISHASFKTMLQTAPLSVVSLPFYQTTHLPGTMILCHEIGHVVDFDLQLTSEIDEALKATQLDGPQAAVRLAYWKSCRLEIFADAYGALVGGSSFLTALGHFLATDKGTVVDTIPQTLRGDTNYPTVYLRVLLCEEVIRQNCGGVLPARAEEFMKSWRAAYGPDHKGSGYVNDLPKVVAALLDTSLEGLQRKSVRQAAGGFSMANETTLVDEIDRAKNRRPIGSSDARVLFAAAAGTYYDDPAVYVTQDVATRLGDTIRNNADNTPRNAAAAVQANVTAADQAAGRELLELLG